MPTTPRSAACIGRASAATSITTMTAPEPADVLAAMVEAKDIGEGARRLRAAHRRLPRAQGQARGNPRRQGRRRARRRSPTAPAPKVGSHRMTAVPLLRERLGVSRRRHHLRQGARRRGEEVSSRSTSSRRTGTLTQADHRRAQRPRSPTSRSTSSSPTWSAGAGCRTISATPTSSSISPDFTLRVMHDGKLVWRTRIVIGKPDNADADHAGGDEIHHRQSDLERAAVDRQQRISAGAAAGSDGARAHGTEGRQEPRRHRAHLAAAGRPATRSAASASTSPTSSWSISTTRRTSICSPTTSAPTATAACGCRIRRNMPRCCCRWCGRTTATRTSASRR